MKYLIIAVFLVLAGLVAYRQLWSSDEPGPVRPIENDAELAGLPAGENPINPNPSDTDLSSVGLTEPTESGDLLRDAVYETVMGVLAKEPEVAEQDANFERLAQVFRDAGTRVGATVEFAITDTLTMMELEIAKARPPQGLKLPLDPTQQAFVESQALRYTSELRRRAMPQSGNVTHDGSMLASKPIEEMDIKGGFVGLSWKSVGDYSFKEGMELSEKIIALREKKIAMTGYMMAMGQFEHIREFLLVESQWTCCFGTTPDINQVVVVTLPDDHIGLDLVTRPVLVYGSFEAGEEREDGWLISLYRIRADDVEEAP